MAYSLEGTFFENCSCNAICPCTWSNGTHRATQDYCRAALAFRIETGNIEGTDVSGHTMVLVLDSPPQMLEGGWKVGVVIDDGASQPQVDAITKVMSGQLGGPPAALGPLLGEFLGVIQHPIAITEEGGQFHVKVGDAIEYTGVPEVTENGTPVELTNIVIHPAGPNLQIAHALSGRGSIFGFDWSGEDLSGFTSAFNWAA